VILIYYWVLLQGMLYRLFIKKWKKGDHHEPYFEKLAMIFWAVNAGIVVIHFAIAIWLYTYFSTGIEGQAPATMLFPVISLCIVLGMALLYRNPQYSNVPYSLLLEELPEKRQKELRYIFQQLLVTSAGYLAVFFLSVQIHSVAVLFGLGLGFFVALYAFLAVLLAAKFGFATWFVAVTREKRSKK